MWYKASERITRAVGEGFRATLAFVIQMDGLTEVRQNTETHPEFGKAFEDAGQGYGELTEQIDALQEEKQKLLLEDANGEGLRQRMNEIVGFLEQQETAMSEYREDLVRKLIERITVYEDRCDVEFKSGIIVEVYI